MKRIVELKLKWLTKLFVSLKKPQVIGVAGSVGKTSTKLAIAHVLSAQCKVLVNEGSYNSAIGLPLSVFELKSPDETRSLWAWLKIFIKITAKFFRKFPYDVIVLEYGVDQPGDMADLLGFVKPKIAVVTAVSPEHMELLIDMETVAAEELAITKVAQISFVNGDDVADWFIESYGSSDTIKLYGSDGQYPFYYTMSKSTGITGQASFQLDTFKINNLTTNFVSENGLKSLLVAAAIAEHMNVSKDKIEERLKSLSPAKGRMRLFDGINGSQIIDDSYNSSPLAVISALDTLNRLKAKRRVAVLGSMNELGDYAETGYKEAVAEIGKIDLLVCVGAQASDLFPKYVKLAKKKISTFDGPIEAGEFLKQVVRKGDIVLVKGSQNGVFTEETVKMILKDQSERSQLVRQSDFWIKKKQQQFPKVAK